MDNTLNTELQPQCNKSAEEIAELDTELNRYKTNNLARQNLMQCSYPDLMQILWTTNIKINKAILSAIIGLLIGSGISIAIYLTGAVQFSDITFSSIPSHFSSVGLNVYRTMLEPYTWSIMIFAMILSCIIGIPIGNRESNKEIPGDTGANFHTIRTKWLINTIFLGFVVGGALGTITGTLLAATLFKTGACSATNTALHFPIIQGAPELCQQLASDEAIMIITSIALSFAIIGAVTCFQYGLNDMNSKAIIRKVYISSPETWN